MEGIPHNEKFEIGELAKLNLHLKKDLFDQEEREAYLKWFLEGRGYNVDPTDLNEFSIIATRISFEEFKKRMEDITRFSS